MMAKLKSSKMKAASSFENVLNAAIATSLRGMLHVEPAATLELNSGIKDVHKKLKIVFYMCQLMKRIYIS